MRDLYEPLERGRHWRYQVDTALLNAGIIPEHLLKTRDWKETTGGRGGIFHSPEGPPVVVCEHRGCSNGFTYQSTTADPAEGLEQELRTRGWSFREYYTEEHARPVAVTLSCPEHA